MTIEFKLQEVSEGVESVDIAEIRVQPGDVITPGTVVCEVETDKAVAEIECPHAGTVKEVLVSPGDTVPIGAPLLLIEETAAADSDAPQEPATPEISTADSGTSSVSADSEPAAAADTASADAGTDAASSEQSASVVEFLLPAVSEDVTSVDVAEVLVSPGDRIAAGTVVCEVETDKAVAEIECPHAGTIESVHIKAGDHIDIGAPLLTIRTVPDAAAGDPKDSQSGSAAQTPAVSSPPSPAPSPAQPVSVPAPSPASQTAAAPIRPAGSGGANDADVNTAHPPPPAGPATRRLARKLGVDLRQVTGSARGGRIVIEDVEVYVRSRLAAPQGRSGSLATGIVPATSLPDFSQFGPVEREPLNKIYRAAAVGLHESWLTIPHVTQHDLADVTELETARRRYVQANPNAPKITMTAIMIKAVVGALKAFPRFNSSLDMETGEWVIKKYYHIGVAVDTPKGLVVPVIRNCDQKNVLQVAAELSDLAERARNRRLKPSEMRGASFTITNLGGIGGTSFTPIVNYPEVAILGLSRGQKQLRLENGELVERIMLPLSLSYDHRAINGADAARFIVKLSGSLTNLFELF